MFPIYVDIAVDGPTPCVCHHPRSGRDVNEARLLEAKAEAEHSRIWPRDRGQASRPNISTLRSLDNGAYIVSHPAVSR